MTPDWSVDPEWTSLPGEEEPTDQVAAYFREVHQLGCTLLPLPKRKKKAPPAGWNSQGFRGLEPDSATATLNKGNNVAVRLGGKVYGVDADNQAAIDNIESMLNGTTTLTVDSPKGRHYYFTSDTPIGQTQVNKENVEPKDNIDIRSAARGYLLCPGSAISKAEYLSDGGSTPDDTDGPWFYEVKNLQTPAPIPANLLEYLQRRFKKPVVRTPIELNGHINRRDPFALPYNGVQVPRGIRDSFLTEIVGKIVAHGISIEHVVKATRYLAKCHFDLSDSQVNKIIRSVVAMDKKNAPWRERNIRFYKKEENSYADDLRNRLYILGIEVRANSRNMLIETREGKGKWLNWNKTKDNIIARFHSDVCTLPRIEEVEDKKKKGKTKLVLSGGFEHKEYPITKYKSAFRDTALQNEIDPFITEFLSKLPEWDGKPRLEKLIFYCFDVDEEYHLLAKNIIRVALMGAVRRSYNPGCKHDLIPVLIGAEGIGKSTLWRMLAIRQEWFFDALDMDLDNKRIIEEGCGSVIQEWSELVGAKRADIAKQNAYITRQYDRARMAYDPQRTDKPRDSIIVGTTNETDALPVTPGEKGRRFLPVAIRKKQGLSDKESAARVYNCLANNYKQLWAEAIFLVNENNNPGIDKALEQQAYKMVGEHAVRDTVTDEAVGRFLLERWMDEWIDVSDVLEDIEGSNIKQVIPTLKRLGAYRARRTIETGQRVHRWHNPYYKNPGGK